MFRRKIENELLNWKNNLNFNKKAFILKGLRQVGKTFIVRKFAKENFKNVIYINFKLSPEMKICFDGDLDVDQLILNISSKIKDAVFQPKTTVLIFDEIQECSAARTSIKSFMDDGRFDIIATGSLLGIKGYNSKYSGGVSVGYEHVVYLKAMDFEEFLWANNVSEDVISYLKDCFIKKEKISESIHLAMMRKFREYICVGGMPAVVKVFVNTKDMNQVRIEQRDILEGYKDDFAKHLDEKENEKVDLDLLAKIHRVFESIPSQLSKENKKFMISKFDKKSSIAKYESAIQWLIDYGLIQLCYNVSNLEQPLDGNKMDNIFKVYMCDSGLLISMLDDDAAGEILLNDLGIYKGAIYENIVADAFNKNNKKLFYYSKNSGLEIDFVMNYHREITLIEVKSKTGNTKSSKEILNNKAKYPEVNSLIRLKDCNVGEVDNILSLPYYLTFLLK